MLSRIDFQEKGSLLTSSSGLTQPRYRAVKAVVEFVLAVVLFVLALPVMLVIALLVKLTSRGPVVYSQTRCGLNGKPYRIYKIRTMVHNCEKLSGPCWSKPGDPRITPLGRLLRKTHLDELPQLWNVLRGEMSLVGPRPERPEIACRLARHIPFYQDRMLVKPGVTGLAQVQLPPDTDLESVRRKLMYDLYYIRHAGLWLDLQIMASTAFHALGLSFSIPRTLFRVPTGEPVERLYSGMAAQGEAVLQMQSAS